MRFKARSRACLLVACLLVFSVSFGCFERVEIISAEREKISEAVIGDADGDGVKDQFVFKFEPVLLVANTTLARTMTVKGILKPPVYLVNLTDIREINATAIEQARFELKEFNNARNKLTAQGLGVEKRCRERLGIGADGCEGKVQCFAACQNSVECKFALSSLGEPILDSVVEFQSSANQLDDGVRELDEDLKAVEETAELATVKNALDGYGEVRKLAGKYSSNLLFDKNFYGLCEPVPFDFSRLENSRQLFINAVKVGPNETLLPGVRFVGPTEFEVAMQLKLERKTSDIASEIVIIEEIPKAFTVDAGRVSFGLNYSEISSRPPFAVKWSFTNIGGAVRERSIIYIVHSAPEPEGGWESFANEQMERPRVDIKSITLSTIPGYNTAFEIYARQAGLAGFFPALAMISAEALILLLWANSLARFVFTLFMGIKNKMALKDVLYEWAGRGGQNRLTYLGIGAIAIGLGFGVTHYYALPGVPIDADFIVVITETPTGAAASGCFFFGIMSFYFIVLDVIKGAILGKRYLEKPIPIGVRAVLFESQIVDLSKILNDKIDVLLKRASEAKKMKFSFDAEESDAEEVKTLLKQAVKSARDGDIADANAQANTAKLKYQRLVERTGEKLNHLNELIGLVKDVHSASELANSLLREGKAIAAPVGEEEIELKKVGVDEALAKAEEEWSVNDFDAAEQTLSKTVEKLVQIEKDLKEKVGERKGLIERKFNCPECGKNIGIVSASCEYCGANIAEALSRKINKMKDEVEKLKKKIGEAKELVRFEYEEQTISELKIVLGKALHAVETGSYDEAARVIEAEAGRLEMLGPAVGDKLKSYEGVSKRIANLEDRMKDILELFDQAKKFELSVEREDRDYKEIDVDSMLGKAETLFKQDKFDEADEILTSVEDAYEDLERKLSDAIEDYRNAADKVSLLSKEILAASGLVSKCKGFGVDVASEENDLRNVNVQALRSKIKERKPVSMDADEAASKIADLRKKLAKKLEYAELFSERIREVETKSAEVEALTAKCISLGIDSGKEQKELAATDVRELKSLFEKAGDAKTIQKKINDAVEAFGSAKISLKQKLAMAEQWAQWSPHITQLLERKDKVTENMLSSIPEKWRRWALERYVLEHLGEALVMEEGTLVKLSLPAVSKFQFELILQNLALSEKIDAAAIVRRDGLPIASSLPPGIDPETIAALATKMLSKAEATSTELKKGVANRVMIGSEGGKMIVTSAGKTAVLVALVKPKEDMGFVLMVLNQATSKITELLGG